MSRANRRRQGHQKSAPSDRRPKPDARPDSITCPVCLRTSYNPTDIAEGYCGNCNDWTSR